MSFFRGLLGVKSEAELAAEAKAADAIVAARELIFRNHEAAITGIERILKDTKQHKSFNFEASKGGVSFDIYPAALERPKAKPAKAVNSDDKELVNFKATTQLPRDEAVADVKINADVKAAPAVAAVVRADVKAAAPVVVADAQLDVLAKKQVAELDALVQKSAAQVKADFGAKQKTQAALRVKANELVETLKKLCAIEKAFHLTKPEKAAIDARMNALAKLISDAKSPLSKALSVLGAKPVHGIAKARMFQELDANAAAEKAKVATPAATPAPK